MLTHRGFLWQWLKLAFSKAWKFYGHLLGLAAILSVFVMGLGLYGYITGSSLSPSFQMPPEQKFWVDLGLVAIPVVLFLAVLIVGVVAAPFELYKTAYSASDEIS